jgi:hypothetical protein
MLYMLSSKTDPATFLIILTISILITVIIFAKEKKHDPKRA